MIKFFRRIRQKLINEGNLKRYLIYAIGEILLVVIGILIALQLNTWNEHRKLQLLEKEYLIDLRKEFVENQATALDNIVYHQFSISNAELILKSCQGDTILLNVEPLAVAIEHVGWTYSIGYIKDVWTELNSTGNLRIISNKSLRKSLTKFYGNMDIFIIEEKECASFNLGVRRVMGEVLNPKLRLDIHEKLHPTKYSGLVTDMPDQKLLTKKLNQLRGVNGYLVDIIEGRKTTMSMLNGDLSTMNDILKTIDNELNKN